MVGYDDNNNLTNKSITSKVNGGIDTSYIYDDAGNLTYEVSTIDDIITSYGYDEYHRLTAKMTDFITTSKEYSNNLVSKLSVKKLRTTIANINYSYNEKKNSERIPKNVEIISIAILRICVIIIAY